MKHTTIDLPKNFSALSRTTAPTHFSANKTPPYTTFLFPYYQVTDLKRSDFFDKQINEFGRLKALQHKQTAEVARKHHEKTLEMERLNNASEKEAKKAKRESDKQAKVDAGMDEEAAEAEIAAEEAEEEAKEEKPKLPDVMEEWSEEDWMLAMLRVELHTRRRTFLEKRSQIMLVVDHVGSWRS